jgi:hypothetical protein
MLSLHNVSHWAANICCFNIHCPTYNGYHYDNDDNSDNDGNEGSDDHDNDATNIINKSHILIDHVLERREIKQYMGM